MKKLTNKERQIIANNDWLDSFYTDPDYRRQCVTVAGTEAYIEDIEWDINLELKSKIRSFSDKEINEMRRAVQFLRQRLENN